MTPDSRMLAASIGKTLVAATVISLWEEGKLDLDIPVSNYLGHHPWYSRLANSDSMTVRQLLGHRSGVADHVYTEEFASELAQRWQEPDALFGPEQFIALFLDKPAQVTPDREFVYSDTGYILIGLVIEAVSGLRYYEAVEARFIDPLALTSTSPSDQRSLPGLAAGYTDIDNPFGFPTKSITESGNLTWHPGLEWTGGGLVSTSADLAKWGHALFTGEALSRRGLNAMLQGRVINPAVPESRYGLGVAMYHGEAQGDDSRACGLDSRLRIQSATLHTPRCHCGLSNQYRHWHFRGKFLIRCY